MEYAEKQEEMFSRQAERLVRAGKIAKDEKNRWIIEKKVVSVADKFGLDYNRKERK